MIDDVRAAKPFVGANRQRRVASIGYARGWLRHRLPMGQLFSLGRNMHAAIQIAAFWGTAFMTLCVAVVLLNIFGGIIDSDMELLSLGKEAALAGIASLIEAAGVWLIVIFVPAMHRGLALRGMIVPILIVGFIYRIAHFESWSMFEAGLLLAFQVAFGCLVASLVTGHFQAAIMLVVVVGIILAVVASIIKGL